MAASWLDELGLDGARSYNVTKGDPKPKYPVTPDGRYFVVRGRLWRMSNPQLAPAVREQLVKQLMDARRDVGAAKRANDREAEADARGRVNAAKVALGERGPVWWDTDEGDYNRHLAKNTPYAAWFGGLGE